MNETFSAMDATREALENARAFVAGEAERREHADDMYDIPASPLLAKIDAALDCNKQG